MQSNESPISIRMGTRHINFPRSPLRSRQRNVIYAEASKKAEPIMSGHGISRARLVGGAWRRVPCLIMLDAIVALILTSISLAMPPRANAFVCDAPPDLTAAHLRWSNARTIEPSNRDKICRIYRSQFYEAAVTRQAVANCKVGAELQKETETLDAEIESINEMIASRCDGF
jgi:hypothetical protein